MTSKGTNLLIYRPYRRLAHLEMPHEIKQNNVEGGSILHKKIPKAIPQTGAAGRVQLGVRCTIGQENLPTR
jgi:hypothetical protein